MGTHQHFGSIQLDDVAGLRRALRRPRSMLENDMGNFGDLIESFPRLLAANQVAAVGGAIYCAGGYAPTGGSATHLNMQIGTTAAAGTGTLALAFYRGSSPSSISRWAIGSGNATLAAANSAPRLAFSTAAEIEEGEFVAAMFLCTGFSTMPTFRALVGGGPGTAILSPNGGPGRLLATATGQTALPATADLSASPWSTNSLPHWWSVSGSAA